MSGSPYHEWGDNWPHWKELYQAKNYIENFVKRYSRCSLMMKEKYGTIRYEHLFTPVNTSVRMPTGFRKILYILFNRMFARLGERVMNIAIRNACNRFPNVSEEILDDAWWLEDE